MLPYDVHVYVILTTPPPCTAVLSIRIDNEFCNEMKYAIHYIITIYNATWCALIIQRDNCSNFQTAAESSVVNKIPE